jgi:hypothetical protein
MCTILLSLLATARAAPIGVLVPNVRLSHQASLAHAELRPARVSKGIAVTSRVVAGEPMDLQRLSYRLVGGREDCDAGMAHTAVVWKESGGVQQAIQGFHVSEVPDAAQRAVSLAFQRPIHLDRGESLVVAVELLRDGDLAMCMATSNALPSPTEAPSTDLEPAYRWQTVAAVGLPLTLDIRASGVYTARRPP